MRSSIILCISIALVTLSCNTNGTKDPVKEKDSYVKTKETLLEKEQKNPASFLTASGHDRHNIIGQTVVKGKISSTAAVCTYHDIDLKLTYFSKTGTLLETDNETIYEVVKPGQSINFKTKYYTPKGTDSVSVIVLTAKTGDK